MEKSILVLDTESTTYEKGNPFSKPNRLMCIGTLYDGILEYHDIEHSGLPYHSSIKRVGELLAQANLIIGFNIKYDLHWLRSYFHIRHFTNVFDCQLADFLLRNQTNPYPDLDFTARLRGIEPKHDIINHDYWSKGLDTNVVPIEILKDRVLSDCTITYEVYLQQKKELIEQGKQALFEVQCQDLLTLQEMEYNGMLYDTKKSIQMGDEVEAKLKSLEMDLLATTDGISINPDSPHQLSALLYGGWIKQPIKEHYTKTLKSGQVKEYVRNGFEYKQLPRLLEPLKGSEGVKTAGMNPTYLEHLNERRKTENKPLLQRIWSTDEPTLRSLKATGKSKQIIKLMLEQSKLEKLRGTYYRGIPELIDKKQWNGNILHGQLNQCVARTGRLSSSNPNLQNFAGDLKPLFPARNDILINVDAKGLEWVCANYLCQDPIGMEEILQELDHHEINRKRFGLPSRLIAKVFMFRLIYGGSAYSFAHDPDFTDVSISEKYWQKVIDETYNKYKGLKKWHTNLVKEVVNTGQLVMPTGRRYLFKKKEGHFDWPETQIKNYPVQGLGADLLSIIRVSLYKRMQKKNLSSLLICTVHDSILIDAVEKEVDILEDMLYSVFDDLPKNFKRVFGVDFNLPLRGVVSLGRNWGEMTELKRI